MWMQQKEAPKVDGEKKAADAAVKKEDASVTAVFKIDMHCEGCAKKIKRAMKHYPGEFKISSNHIGNVVNPNFLISTLINDVVARKIEYIFGSCLLLYIYSTIDK